MCILNDMNINRKILKRTNKKNIKDVAVEWNRIEQDRTEQNRFTNDENRRKREMILAQL